MNLPHFYSKSRIGAAANEMVLIPAGEFIMGSDERLSDEGPQHKVSLSDYYMEKIQTERQGT